jgi:cobalt-zinc-cadmium efflux system outer membrane protein
VLSRDDAVNEALLHNPELATARARLGLVEADVLKARRLVVSNPRLQADYGSDRLLDNEGELRASVTLSQEVEIAGQRGLRRQWAGLRKDEAEMRLRDLELAVARDAADAWYAAWRTERLRGLARSTLEVSRALDRGAASRFAAGDISLVERNIVALDVARAEAAVAVAEADAVRARAELGRLLGRPGPASVTIAAEPGGLLTAAVVEQLLDGALDRRADLQAASLAEHAAAAELRLRHRERVPNPTFSLAYNQELFFVSGRVTGIPAPVRLDHTSNILLVRLALSLPLWDRQQAEIRAARATRSTAEAALRATEQRARAELESARAAVVAAERALAIYQEALPRAEQNLAELEGAYGAGQVGLVELLAAKDRAFLTQREYIEARANHGRAIHELLRAAGLLPTGEGR